MIYDTLNNIAFYKGLSPDIEVPPAGKPRYSSRHIPAYPQRQGDCFRIYHKGSERERLRSPSAERRHSVPPKRHREDLLAPRGRTLRDQTLQRRDRCRILQRSFRP